MSREDGGISSGVNAYLDSRMSPGKHGVIWRRELTRKLGYVYTSKGGDISALAVSSRLQGMQFPVGKHAPSRSLDGVARSREGSSRLRALA